MQRRAIGRWLRWALLGPVGLAFAAMAQGIVVAPHAVFIDHRTRSAVVHLYNPSDRPEEVSISFVFGYPTSDSEGNVYIRFVEEPPPGTPAATQWIRAFPRRMVVAPGQRRVVRLLAQPPSSLPDGEYWTRLVVTARGTEPPVAAQDTGVRVGLALEVRTVIAVSYRKGPLTTGVEVADLTTAVEGDSLVVRLGMRRKGTAAYLGTAELALKDSTGATRAEWGQAIAVYYDLVRRVALPVAGLAPGAYTLDLRLETKRSDIPQEQVVPAEPVRRLLEVRLG